MMLVVSEITLVLTPSFSNVRFHLSAVNLKAVWETTWWADVSLSGLTEPVFIIFSWNLLHDHMLYHLFIYFSSFFGFVCCLSFQVLERAVFCCVLQTTLFQVRSRPASSVWFIMFKYKLIIFSEARNMIMWQLLLIFFLFNEQKVVDKWKYFQVLVFRFNFYEIIYGI